MANNDRIAKTLLKFQTDKGSLREGVNAYRSIGAAAEQAGKEVREAFSGSGTSGLSRRLGEARGTIQDATKDARELTQALRQAASASGQINVGRAQGRLGAADTAGSRASQILGGLGQGEAANLAGLVADISAAASDALPNLASMGIGAAQIGVAAGVAAPLLIAAGAALASYNAQVNAAHAAYRAARQAQQELAEQIAAGLTTEEATRRLEELRAAEAALTQQLDADTQALRGAVTSIAGPIGSITGAFRPLQESVTESTAALADNQAEQAALEGALQGTALAANDAAIAQRELANATIEASQAALDAAHARIQSELEFQRLAQTGTSESIQQQIAENQAEMALIQQELATNTELGALATLQLHGEFAALLVETDRLTNETLGLVEAREKEAGAARTSTAISQRLTQQIERENQVRGQIAQLQAGEARRQSDLHRQELREQVDFQRRRTLQIIDFNRDLARADADFAQRRQQSIDEQREADAEGRNDAFEVVEEANREGIRRAQEYQQELADIERDAREGILEGAANLDARAVLAAQRNRDRQLEEARRGYEEEQRDRETNVQERLQEITQEREQRAAAFAQQLADEQTQYQQRREQQVADFNERLQREDTERQIQRARAAEDEGLRRADYITRLNELRSHLTMESALRRSGFAGVLADTQVFFNNLRNMARGFSGGSSGAASANRNTGDFAAFVQRNSGANVNRAFDTARGLAQSGIKSRALGGDTSGLTMVGERGRELAYFPNGGSVMNNQQTEALLKALSGGGRNNTANTTINGSGLNEAQLERVIVNVLGKVFS